MDLSLDTVVGRIVAAERVTPEDTIALRPIIWGGTVIERAHAEALFAINAAARKTCPQWVDFFVEAITAYLIEAAQPRGHVDAENAEWLIGQIGREGRLETRAELLMLVAVFEKAESVAGVLRRYALAQIERAVITGEGATRIGSAPRTGAIDEAEVALLRRIFFAPGSSDGCIISDDEAAAMFRIKNATMNADNAPGWATLFVQIIGNHLVERPSANPVTPERTVELDAFMNDHMPNVGGFLSRMEAAFLHPSTVIDAFTATPESFRETTRDRDPAITMAEANWLKAQIVADGAMDDLEKALLAFVIDESGPLPVAIEAPPLAMRA